MHSKWNYCRKCFKKISFQILYIFSKRFNFDADILFISTLHNNHASNVIKGLNANKNVYVDKPLCLNLRELN